MLQDRAIHEQVLVALCRELDVGIETVSIRVDRGVVLLSGVVDTPAERQACERAAWGVPGVRALVQRLAVRRARPGGPTDRELAVAVLSALDARGRQDIRVRVQEGLVAIGGTFGSEDERDSLAGRLTAIPGVVNVVATDWATNAPRGVAGRATLGGIPIA